MTQDNDPWGDNPRNTEGNEIGSFFNGLKDNLFGKGSGSDNSQQPSSEPSNGLPNIPKKALLPIAAVALLGWGSTGLYILPEGFNGVELMFGKYKETSTQPGFNLNWPYPVGSVQKVDIGSLKNITVGGSGANSEGQMLTADENIVEVSLSVQYKIEQAEKYLFNVNDPETVLRETLISSIREVVGSSSVDYVLTDGRAEWPAKVRENLVNTLKGFDVGFDILRVELRDAKAPSAVQAAFDDAVKAREDAERYKLQAQAYQNEKIPLARGQAREIIEEAEAYKASVIAQATGEASRFENILTSYKLAPAITRDRLYIETMQSIYKNVNNIVVATGENAPVMYLPMTQGATAAPLPKPQAEKPASSDDVKPLSYKIPEPKVAPISHKPSKERLTR